MRSLKVYEIVNLFNWEEMIKKNTQGNYTIHTKTSKVTYIWGFMKTVTKVDNLWTSQRINHWFSSKVTNLKGKIEYNNTEFMSTVNIFSLR